jgi:hypothetical protein
VAMSSSPPTKSTLGPYWTISNACTVLLTPR